jgi:hypothetical protein
MIGEDPYSVSKSRKMVIQIGGILPSLFDAVTGSANSAAQWVTDKTGWNPQSVGPAIMNWLGAGNQQAGTAAHQYSLSGENLLSGNG